MSSNNVDSIVMTVDEVAEFLKLSKITVYKLTQKGEIPGFRIGSSWRYNKDVIDEIARVGTKQVSWSYGSHTLLEILNQKEKIRKS